MSDGREGEREVSQPVSDYDLSGTTCAHVLINGLDGSTTAWVKGQHLWWRPWESQGPHLLGQDITAQGYFLRWGRTEGQWSPFWGHRPLMKKLMEAMIPHSKKMHINLGCYNFRGSLNCKYLDHRESESGW